MSILFNSLLQKLRTMQTTYDQDFKPKSDKITVYDHTCKTAFDLESEIVFKPTRREDCLPNWDLVGQSLHLSKIQMSAKKESTSLSAKMKYALIKWPEELPGLLYGIVPVDIFIHQREIYKDPYTDSIPDADPEWGSYQYIKTVWSKRSQYCLLIAEGSLESMKICFDVVCARYFKIDNLTSDIIG